MKRIYITFGGKAYDETTERIVDDAPKFGVDEVKVYDDRWLIENTKFLEMNSWLFGTGVKPAQPELKFGFGWCSWKPLIILDALKGLIAGDVVLYTDADTYPIADLTPIFDGCRDSKEGIFLFESQGCLNGRFTRGDCAMAMCLELHPGRIMGCGRFSLFRAGSFYAQQFLTEWWAYSVNPHCQRVAPSVHSFDDSNYYRHSNEQSILTMLGYKYNLPFHREACQAGWPNTTKPEDTYPQLFVQEWCGGDRTDLSGSRFRNVS